VRSGANGEQVTATLAAAAGPWFELHRFYDPGWHLDGHRPTAVGDGLYNLYHVTAKPTTARSITFKFSTLPWEWIGRFITFLTVVAALVLIWRRRRSPDVVVETPNPSTIEGTIGPLVAAVGVIFLGLMAVASVSDWFGLPSRYPSLAVLPDPYSLDIVLGSVALGVLVLSIVVRVVEHLTQHRSVTAAAPSRSKRWARMAGVGAAATVPLLLASCGGTSIENANQILANARAQSVASRDVTGASLDEARVQFQAKHPYRCVANYTTALKTFPGLASAYAGRAACYQSYNPAASVQDLNRALTLTPDDASLLLARASADRAAGNTGAAVGDYEAAMAAPTAGPTDALVATDGLIAIGSYNGAATVVHEVTSRYPSDALAQLAVADLALAQGNAALVDKSMATAASLAAPGEVVYVLSRQCGLDVLRHQYFPAVATCESAAVQGTDSSGAFDNLSAAHAALGQLSAAISDMTSAIGAFEGNVGPNAQPAGVDGFGLANLLEARGRLYIEQDQTARAIDDYRAALQAVPSKAVDLAARLKQDIKVAKQD
jgi:tetratricopeptide (TPR) repeat protein